MNTHFPTFRRLAGTRISIPFVWPRYTTSAQRRGLLRLIAVGIEEKLPLVPLLAARALDERGQQAIRLQRLVRLLESGTPLADAVEAVPGVLRDEDVLAIRFDAQTGTGTAAVRDLFQDAQAAPTGRSRRPANTLIYFGIVLLLAFPMVVFTQIKIVPVLNQIYEEFDVKQSWPLEWSVGVSNFLARYWWVVALFGLGVIISSFSAWPGRFVRRTLLGRFFQPMRELHTADVLRKIGISLQAGRPVPGALSTLARYHFDPTTRHNLLFVRNEVEQGADVWQSMNAADMLTRPEVRVLATAERVGNRAWALKQLAMGKTRRTLWRLERLSELILPAVVFLLGAFVLIQALSIFMLLTQLVLKLA